MATLKQIAANRRNALKSTGPCSEEGKRRSRRNALKHGLAGSGLVLPLAESAAVVERIAEWHSSLKPFDPYEVWLLGVVAVESIRVDRCRIEERVLRDQQIRRACDSWEDDQRQAAEELAAKLPKSPTAAAKLCKTVAGVSILLDRWNGLSRALENGGWSEAQEGLAHDLLGTPIALREGPASPLNPATNGDLLTHRMKLIHTQIEQGNRLVSQVLSARDTDKRDLVEAGVTDLEDRALMRLHRYESRCFRRLTWATNEMRSKRNRNSPMPDRARNPMDSMPPQERKTAPKTAIRLAESISQPQAKNQQPATQLVANKRRKPLPAPQHRQSDRTLKSDHAPQ